jgi:hypothetical protein
VPARFGYPAFTKLSATLGIPFGRTDFLGTSPESRSYSRGNGEEEAMIDAGQTLPDNAPSLKRAFFGFVTSTTLISTAMVFLSAI